jgi:hypothetical protein
MATRINLPKDLRGVAFSRACPIDLNSFDIDLFLPALFFKILSEGRVRGRTVNDATDVQKYIDALAGHPSLEGFDDAEGRRALARLVRTALIVTGRAGERHRGEAMQAVVPYSLLSHKAGLPSAGRSQRNVDTLVYRAMRDVLTPQQLKNEIMRVFGRGVIIDPLPQLGGRYDGVTQLDTLARLSIAFLDGLEATPAGSERDRVFPDSYPALSRELSNDLMGYLFAYQDLMPMTALTQNFLALINLEVFVYTLRLVHAVTQLVDQPDRLPPAMQPQPASCPPDLYVDFTDRPSGLSQEMATACVRRDLETYQRFLYANLLLRQLDRYIDALRRSPRQKAEIERLFPRDMGGGEYLQQLLLVREDARVGPDLEASARTDLRRIADENRADGSGDESESELRWLETITAAGRSDAERLVLVLAEAQCKKALGSAIMWFWGAGGLRKPFGILAGEQKARRAWRYAPGNDLLAVLVQLAAARVPKDEPGRAAGPAPIRLKDFLDFLHARFGLLVDRPPAGFSGPEYVAAARDNLRAMQRRLRQMGIFLDLSDDFTAQRLEPPYRREEVKHVG